MLVLNRVRTTILVLLTGTAAVLAASLAVVPAASAASHTGQLAVRGPGNSAYTRGPNVSLAVKEGATATFTIQVRNTDTTLAQYKVRVTDDPGLAQLYDGSLLLKPLASSPDGYYTKPLSPGGTQTLTVKIPVPVGTSTYRHRAVITLYGTDGDWIDDLSLIAEEPAVLKGSTAADIFVKSGGQLAVGGEDHFQVATAPTITGNQVATFTVTLQNSTGPTNPIGFELAPYWSFCGAVMVVKDGALDVTAKALDGTYRTPPLAKAGKRVLTITIKNITSACTYMAPYASPKLPGGLIKQQVVLNVNKAG